MYNYNGSITIKNGDKVAHYSRIFNNKENAYEVIEDLHSLVNKKLLEGYKIIQLSATEMNRDITNIPVMNN